MPCTSIFVLQKSTHTYVIKLRGSDTIQPIVTPILDQHKGPHQSRSKPTLTLHNSEVQAWKCLFPLWSDRAKMIPAGIHLLFVKALISLKRSLTVAVLTFFCESTGVDRWWWEFNQGKNTRPQDVCKRLWRRGPRASLSVLCMYAYKGKRQWRCQGWVIAVVFQLCRAGQTDVMDG